MKSFIAMLGILAGSFLFIGGAVAIPQVTVTDLTEQPEAYEGRTIAVEGTATKRVLYMPIRGCITGVCIALQGFSVTDGKSSILVLRFYRGKKELYVRPHKTVYIRGKFTAKFAKPVIITYGRYIDSVRHSWIQIIKRVLKEWHE